MRTSLLAGILVVTYASADQSEIIEKARRSFDEDALIAIHDTFTSEAKTHPEEFEILWGAAEAHRIRADWRLTRRMVNDLDGKENKRLKNEQKEIAEAGLPWAIRAVDAAQTKAEEVVAHRVLGEIYAQLIGGMVSGMRNGPKAKTHVMMAVEMAPEHPEPRRARALMYLHNPSFTGGDVDKAVELFKQCSELNPSSDVYLVQLALAYRKAKQPDDARTAATKALELNPANENARALLSTLADVH